MKKIIIVFLFLVGFISVSLLVIYVFALFVFVFGESDYPGDIAFVPKWIILFLPFVFLGKTKEVQHVVSCLEEFFF